MIKCEFKEDYTIIKGKAVSNLEGDIGESLFIIKEGSVKCAKGNKTVRQLYSKDYFGESAILFETRRSLSVIAQVKTVCFQIPISMLNENLGHNYRDIILGSIVKDAFKKSKYMKLLIFDNYFSKIFPTFTHMIYKNGQVVLGKNDKSKKIIIIIEGNLIQVSNIIYLEWPRKRNSSNEM